ncbi:LacI family DNA-binding transcriptional regulator [Azospirillum picis]|uniref:LacI family transcriptional regulator n=1 Tax=Azospirillum picis TaxID=488438 RepID=A0ABU0MU80_9PROT|nr:substrate-binding domain-containing protein [Azospirillum picis]MBP2299124.1 LacI family transcriptional regulator [Azospirillum picis]MDQ0537050.1 LacI family transcriptional regulator [Azospirillum picis]
MSEREPKPKRPPRAVDVAAAAEVSIATVSRVFNSPEKVAPPIRERVLAAAKAMGWMPHAAGSALARRRSSIVGAVIPTLDNEVFAAQVGAMQTAFAERGITLLLSCFNYNQDQARSDVQAMLARGVEALAIVGESHKPDLFADIQARHIPYVVTYSHRPGSPHPCIGFDNRQAFRKIARHLLDDGHEVIGVIIQPTTGNDRVADRLDGIRDALAERGLGIRPQHLYEGEWSIDFGRQSVRAMLETAPRPTALICGNDYLAIGALLEARAMGLAVPRDLAITGFDDIAISRQMDPPLTTMHIDNHEIGRRAAAYLLSCLQGESPTPAPPLVPTLVLRGTTGALAPARGA